MKLQLKLGMALPVAVGTAIALYGCAQLPFSTTPPAQQDQISGRATFDNKDPGNSLLLGLKRYDGAKYAKLVNQASTDNTGKYGFAGLTDGKYQVFYDDQGQDVTDPTVNTVGVYNTEAVTIASGSANTATVSVNFDVAWPFAPTIKPNDTFTVPSTFGFTGIPAHTDAEYQILVADANKAAVWSSVFGTSKTITWNGKRGSEIATPTTNYTGVGRHYYLIKFRKPGTTWGNEGYYGQTKWVPFTVAR